MIRALKAIAAVLDSDPQSSVPTLIGDATNEGPVFRALWGPPGNREHDERMAGSSAWSARIGLTCTAATAETALMLAIDAIDRLTPGRKSSVIPGLPDRHLQLAFFEARDVQIDRTTTGEHGHPAFVVVLFHLHSQPI